MCPPRRWLFILSSQLEWHGQAYGQCRACCAQTFHELWRKLWNNNTPQDRHRVGLFLLYDVCVNVCTLQTIDSAAETNLVLMCSSVWYPFGREPTESVWKGGGLSKKHLKGDWTKPLSHSSRPIRFLFWFFFTASLSQVATAGSSSHF